MQYYLLFFIFLWNWSYALVDVTITQSYPSDRSVDATTTTHLGAGFFCEFGKVICNLIYFEQDGIRSMYVDWTNQFFPFKDDQHGNGWDLFFEPVVIDSDILDTSQSVQKGGNCNTHDLHDQVCVAQWLRYDDYLPYRRFVHDKINKHIRIKPHILNEIESFYKKHMEGHICIGVHVRYAFGHAAETPKGHPSLQEYCNEVNNLLTKHSNSSVKIFLASDSHVAINYFKAQYGDKLIYLDTYRSSDGQDPGLMYGNDDYWMSHIEEWHKAKPGYHGGLGALMDCLLLSKCDYFIHITSNVASFVCFFSPYIKSIYLPHGVPFEHCRFRGNPSIRNKYLNPI